MTILAASEISSTPLVQTIRIFKSCNIEAIRLYVCKTGTALEGIKLEIVNNGSVLATKNIKEIELNEIGKYYHGYLGFIFDSAIPIRKNPQDNYIELELRVSGTPNISLVRPPDNPNEQYNIELIPPEASLPERIWFSSFGVQIFSNTQRPRDSKG